MIAPTSVDVLIVGAGLSGVGAAVRLKKRCPGKSFAILEARDSLGGTWDLFRYPGVRSDSDMFTLGYDFKPWKGAKAIADGPSILAYVRETAREHDIDRLIHFGHRVTRASWSSKDARWTVEAVVSGTPRLFSARFLFLCAGYYKYAAGYLPAFPDMDRFAGRLVHPQAWPEDLDYAGKRVVVIGSGATAVTVVPAMAETAGHVTMLQRSPTYMVSRPAEDSIANWLRAHLPAKLAYGLTRWKNVLLQMYFFNRARKRPAETKAGILHLTRQALGPDYDITTHFTPRYNPWEQRLCLVPDDDFFAAVRDARAEVVTDHIERFTPQGLALKSGRTLEADIIVTATGLDLETLGGLALAVDGRPVEPGKTLIYKGVLYEGIPNFASIFGYTNASWTLKADLVSAFVCRLINYMDAHGLDQCVPVNRDATVTPEPMVDFSSGYIQRAVAKLPKQGSRAPWRLRQNYARDLVTLRFGPVADTGLEFSRRKRPQESESRSPRPAAAE